MHDSLLLTRVKTRRGQIRIFRRKLKKARKLKQELNQIRLLANINELTRRNKIELRARRESRNRFRKAIGLSRKHSMPIELAQPQPV